MAIRAARPESVDLAERNRESAQGEGTTRESLFAGTIGALCPGTGRGFHRGAGYTRLTIYYRNDPKTLKLSFIISIVTSTKFSFIESGPSMRTGM